MKVEVETPQGPKTFEAEVMLVSIGVLGNVEGVFADNLGVELFKGHIKADPKNGYKTNVPGIYAVGDVIGPPWLAHVAHHEAICCIETLCGKHAHPVDYSNVPGCTYTDPGVASVGLTEKAAREAGHEIRVGKFPFVASGRAQAADETEGFVKLIFDAEARRAPRRPPRRLAGDRADRRAGHGQEARSDRGRDHPRHAPAPDLLRYLPLYTLSHRHPDGCNSLIDSQRDLMAYDFDIVVIGGGPAGYAGAIRAAQLGKRSLCIERDKLGGICLNWGCIPTKALLTNAHLVELISRHGKAFGYSGDAHWDFGQMIGRSRSVAGNLNKGIESLFKKYKVQHKLGTARIVGPNKVQVNGETVTAESIVVATGVRPRPLPGAEFDGQQIISYKEAMSLTTQPKSMVIIGGGPIGLEFGYFYNAIGTKVTVDRAAGPDPAGRGRGLLGRPGQEPDPPGDRDLHQLEDRQGHQIGLRREGRGRDPAGPEDVRGRGHAGLDRRPGERRGRLRRQPEGRAGQGPHQGRPARRLQDQPAGRLRRGRRDRPALAGPRRAPRGDLLHRDALRQARPGRSTTRTSPAAPIPTRASPASA